MHAEDVVRSEEPLLLRIDPDVIRLTSFARSTLYREVAAGRLRAIRVGRAIRVRRCDLDTWLNRYTPIDVDSESGQADPKESC